MHHRSPDSVTLLLEIARRVSTQPNERDIASEDVRFLQSLRSQSDGGTGTLETLLELCARGVEQLHTHADARLGTTLTRAIGYIAKFLDTDGACGMRVLEDATQRLAEILGVPLPEKVRSTSATSATGTTTEATGASTRGTSAAAATPAGATRATPSGANTQSTAPAKAARATLDDAVSLLLTLGPTDQEHIARLAIVLEELVHAETVPERLSCLRDAAQQTRLAIGSDGMRAAELLGLTSELLERATKIPGQAEAAASAPAAAAANTNTGASSPAQPSAGSGAGSAAPASPSTAHASTSTSAAPASTPAAAASPYEVPSGPSIEALPADSDLELLGGFIVESRENLEGAEAALLTLESNPDDLESVNTVFRAFHTVKGSAAFLGLKSMSAFAHKAENLLSRMREREIRCVDHYAELALLSCDMLKTLIDSTERALETKEIRAPDGLWDLAFLLEHPEEAQRPERRKLAPTDAAPEQAIPFEDDAPAAAQTEEHAPVAAVVTPAPRAASATKSRPLAAAPARAVPEEHAEDKSAAEERAAPGEKGAHDEKGAARAGQDASVDSTVRVRTDRLDRLINMVGELVIAQSMVAQDELIKSSTQHDLLKKVGRAGKIVRELQDLSLSLRMVPLKQTFTKMVRIVRDVARKSGKDALLVLQGEDTEIDRNMVDELSDPLVHMVRNAVDHGIEPPEVRLAAGKPAQGTVRLRAYQSGGNVVVEMQDDGRGMSREKLVKKAIEKGLIESDRGMSDADVYNLIFAPGFSTADKITDVSGRGVGMDVVRRKIEVIKGRVDIHTEFGKGTTFRIYLPLTLAITDGMLVQVGQERYIVPITSIRLSFRPTAQQLSSITGRGELVMLRGEPIPIVRLHSLFGRDDAVTDPCQGLLVIVEAGQRPLALLVDGLLGQQQLVAKTLGSHVQRVPGISGGAILGDGSVGLILDPDGLAKLTLAAAPTTIRDAQACAAAD